MTTPTIPCDKCGQPATKWFMQTSVALCDNHECLKYYEDAFALRVLAEKELEVLKLLEALKVAVEMQVKLEKLCLKYGATYDQLGLDKQSIFQKVLSTPPSTEALDEYVAARLAESEDRVNELEPKARRWEWIRHNCLSIKTIGTNTISADEKAIDAAIEAEKVRTE